MPILQTPFFQAEYFGNTVKTYVVAVAAIVAALVVLYVVRHLLKQGLQKFAARTDNTFDDKLVDVIDAIRWPFFVGVAVYVGLRVLALPDSFVSALNIILTAIVVYYAIKMVEVVVSFLMRKFLAGRGSNTTHSGHFLNGIIKFGLWVLGALVILQNAGVDVTALIAGLGIGGIAIAFAIQGILEDLFASFAIFFDRPFEVGDKIVVGEHRGDVEKIGIKSSRIRSPQGEEIIISNKELTNARVQNFKRMHERRVTFTIGVTYETNQKLLTDIPQLITDIIDGCDGARAHRVHFKTFGASSLDFEVTYYVESDATGDYLDVNQEINYKILEAFADKGIDFAYPTQTVYEYKMSK